MFEFKINLMIGLIMMTDHWLVGVDIGGTTIKIAFINSDGEILEKWEIETDVRENGQCIPIRGF